MAIYKIFPDNDSTIYTQLALGNSGLDEILELGGFPINDIGQSARTLIKFKTSEISNVIDNKINPSITTGSFSSSINIFLAEAYEAPTTTEVYSYPLYQSYTSGIGKFGDNPLDKSGVNWVYRNASDTNKWITAEQGLYPANVTASYSSNYVGGGAWYTGSNGIDLESSQILTENGSLDLDLDVTNAIVEFYSGNLTNNGFILKLDDENEFISSSAFRFKYYGGDTNTIFPPTLTFKWDDSNYDTGSLSVLATDQVTVGIKNNKGSYTDEGKQRFRLFARPTFPVRTFSTESVYNTNFALPTASNWALRDEFSEELIIPFDDNYTKISCDSSGPFFDVYMDGLQPERFYRILIKTTLDGTTTVVNNNDIFKVVRNG
tara:strand:+ start:4781 stop:5908 length:1128 start_codon:yes stop_codon:yes gene_type:complete